MTLAAVIAMGVGLAVMVHMLVVATQVSSILELLYDFVPIL